MATQPYNDFLRNAPAKPAQSGWPTASQAQSVYSQPARPAAAPAAATNPLRNPSFANGPLSDQAKAWQASRAVTPTTAPATVQPVQPATFKAGQAVKAMAGKNSPRLGAAAGALAGVTLGSAADSMGRDTEDYYRRFGMDTSNRTLLRDAGARLGGVTTDLGASILDAPVNLANAASRMFGGEGNLRLPGGSFTDIVQRQDQPAVSAASPAPTNKPSLDGGGRSAGIGAKALATPDAPASQFDRRADVQSSIETGVVPDSLRDQRIWRDGNSYTGVGDGTGIGGNKGIADARTGMNVAGGGTVNTISAENFVRGGRTSMQPALSAARAQALREGRLDDVRASFSEGGAPRRAESTYQQALREMRESGVRMTGTNLRAAMNDLTSQRNTAAEIGGRLRENQLQRESDMAIAGARRERNASYVQAAGGDTAIAAQLALRAGDTEAASTLQAGATSQQALSADRTKNAMLGLEQFMETDEKGNITESGRAAVRSEVEKLAPGYFDMTDAERREVQPQVEAALKLLRGANATKDNALLPRWLTGEPRAVRRSTLPTDAELAGATFEPIGRIEGGLNRNVEFGDSALRIKGQETPIYIPAEVAANQEVLEYLKSRGVNIKGLRTN